jgi:hypothetical protein
VDDALKAGVELPNGEEEGVPNVGVDCCWPKVPVDVVPNSELPVYASKVVVRLPNGFGANGLLVVVVGWPNPCCAPNEV